MRIHELKTAKVSRDLAKHQFDKGLVKVSDPLLKQFAKDSISTKYIKGYLQKLGELGFSYTALGSGINAVVLERPNDPYVIKIFKDDRNYLSYCELAVENQGNPFFPKIRGKPVRIATGHPGVYVVRLEKLMPLHGKHPLHEQILDIVGETAEFAGDAFVAARVGNFVKGAGSLKATHPQLYDLFVKISEKMGKQTELDVHRGNMMLRGDQLVVIDPVR